MMLGTIRMILSHGDDNLLWVDIFAERLLNNTSQANKNIESGLGVRGPNPKDLNWHDYLLSSRVQAIIALSWLHVSHDELQGFGWQWGGVMMSQEGHKR